MTVDDHFPMSSKMFKCEYGDHHKDLVSFTTICPGAGPGKDAYWVIDDVCKHVVEVSHIFKWVHRIDDVALQPKMCVIFDGSSNHKARSEDALHVGEGVCKRPGGKNAPGARGTKRYPEGVPKMRDGWYFNSDGNKIVQPMHRQKTYIDDLGNNKGARYYNENDGLIFKGVEEILQEGLDNFIAEDKIKMPYRCSVVRRGALKFPTTGKCPRGRRCCLLNTLSSRPDFLEQKCQLHEVCETVGAEFIMLMICHPECNPIEGGINFLHPNIYYTSNNMRLNQYPQTFGIARKGTRVQRVTIP
jgi:hypothetical protein